MPETSFSSRFQWFHSVFGYCLPLTFGSAKVGATGRSRGTSEPQALDVAQSYCLTAGNDEGTWRASKMFLIKHVHRSGNQHLKFCLENDAMRLEIWSVRHKGMLACPRITPSKYFKHFVLQFQSTWFLNQSMLTNESLGMSILKIIHVCIPRCMRDMCIQKASCRSFWMWCLDKTNFKRYIRSNLILSAHGPQQLRASAGLLQTSNVSLLQILFWLMWQVHFRASLSYDLYSFACLCSYFVTPFC